MVIHAYGFLVRSASIHFTHSSIDRYFFVALTTIFLSSHSTHHALRNSPWLIQRALWFPSRKGYQCQCHVNNLTGWSRRRNKFEPKVCCTYTSSSSLFFVSLVFDMTTTFLRSSLYPPILKWHPGLRVSDTPIHQYQLVPRNHGIFLWSLRYRNVGPLNFIRTWQVGIHRLREIRAKGRVLGSPGHPHLLIHLSFLAHEPYLGRCLRFVLISVIS